MCWGEDFQHRMDAWLVIVLEEFCLFNFEQFWKIRRQIPFKIAHDCLVLYSIINIVFSLIFFIAGIGILNNNKEAVASTCADEWWVWSYCMMALVAPIVIGAGISLVKAVLLMFARDRYQNGRMNNLEISNKGVETVNLFINLGHPIGRTIMFILGVFLSAGMPASCALFYKENYPGLLTLFNFLIFCMFLSALISFVVFFIAILELKVNTPRYVATALAYLEDLSPFSFYKTHVILNTDGYAGGAGVNTNGGIDEVNRTDFTLFQLALLFATAIYFGWGVAVLFHDEEARSLGACTKEADIWSYVLAALLLLPLTGIIVVLLRQWRARRQDLDADARASIDLWISVPQPLVTACVAVLGAVLASHLSTYCSSVYQDAAPDLLFFFEFQVVMLCAAAILGLIVFGLGLGRRAALVYQTLLEQEDDLSGMAAQRLYEEDMYRRSDQYEQRDGSW